MILNKEEMFIAIILTAISSVFPYMILAIPVCAFFWAITGAGESKLWRRLGVPTIWAMTYLNWWVLLLVPISFGFLSLGYGIPSLLDEGSWLGKIAWNITGHNSLWANILTRGIIYTGAVLPFIIFRVLYG